MKFKVLNSDLFQSLTSFLLKIGSGFAAYAFVVFISRQISLDEFGSFSMLFSISLMVGIGGSMGLQVFVVREIPIQKALGGDVANEWGVYLFAVRTLAFSLPIAFVVYLGVGRFLVPSADLGLLCAGAALAILYAVSQATFGMLRVQGKALLAVFSRDLLWRILAIPIAFVLASYYKGPEVGIVAMLAALVPIVLWHVSVIRRQTASVLRRAEKPIGSGAWPGITLGLAFIAVISSADFYVYTVLVGVLLTPVDAGLFFAAIKTAELLNMFLMAVSLIIGPKLSHLIAANDVRGLQAQSNLGIILQSVPLIVSVCMLLPMSSFILSFFDPSYAAAWPLLWLLGAIMLLNGLTGATVLLMQVGGMHWLQVALQGGFLIASLLALPVLIAQFGVYGAALSFGASKLLWNVSAILAIRRKLKIDPSVLGLLRPNGVSDAIALMKNQIRGRI